MLFLLESSATAESTRVVRWPPAPGCKYLGGWIIGPGGGPRGGIAIHECGNQTMLALEQFHESEDAKYAITRATLEFSQIGHHPIVPCRADGSLVFSDIVVLSELPYDHLKPTFLKAWKADTATWEFRELDPAAVECALWPPLDD